MSMDQIEPPDMGDFEIQAKAAFEKIEDKARQLGLYSDQVHAMMTPDGQMVLVVQFLLGDIAFSDRVQNPQKHQTTRMVDDMEKSMQTDTFLEERERIKRNLEAGRDPLDDGPDEELGN